MATTNILNDKEYKFIGYFIKVDIYPNQIKNYNYNFLSIRLNNLQTADLIAFNIWLFSHVLNNRTLSNHRDLALFIFKEDFED